MHLSIVACRAPGDSEHLVVVPVAPPSERPRPLLAQPPARARDDEADAFSKGGRARRVADLDDAAGSARSATRAVECPEGATWTGSVCRVTDVSCPSGSHLVGLRCIGEVKCPDESTWDGSMCRPRAVMPVGSVPTAPHPSPPRLPVGAETCQVNFNTLPVSEVFVDGTALGPTPRVRAVLPAGRHVVLFVAGQMAKKSVSFTCAPGETKSVVAKLFE